MAANRLAFNLPRAFDACADADGDITEAHFLQLCQARFLGVTGGTGAQADALAADVQQAFSKYKSSKSRFMHYAQVRWSKTI
jgi:hypothetical protein